MKGFFIGLTTGLATSVAAQIAVANRHEEIAETLRNLDVTTICKRKKNASLDELLEQKKKLEELIVQKQAEQETADTSSAFSTPSDSHFRASNDPFETT